MEGYLCNLNFDQGHLRKFAKHEGYLCNLPFYYFVQALKNIRKTNSVQQQITNSSHQKNPQEVAEGRKPLSSAIWTQ